VSGGVRFWKMSGAGNDFIVLGREEAAGAPRPFEEWVRRVCRRGVSVGADGVLVVEPAGEPDRIRVRFLNPDGGEAFCGNGSRCAARFAVLRGMAAPVHRLETRAGEIAAEVRGGEVHLTLPPPIDEGILVVEVGGEALQGRRVRAGVPHFVLTVPEVESSPLQTWGPALRRHPAFGSEGTNVDLLARRQDGDWSVRTWERGVEGETLACGSGAVAAALVARGSSRDDAVRLIPRSGILLQVVLSGPAESPSAAVLVGDARVVMVGEIATEAAEGFPLAPGRG
jgi:diaminopimelate epimerase